MNKLVFAWLTGIGLSFATCTAGAAAVKISSVTLGSSSNPLAASAAQQPGTIAPGGVATYQVTVTSSGSGNLNALLSISGLPDRASAKFSPNVVKFNSKTGTSESSVLTVTTSNSLPVGTYSFVVTASHGGRNDSQSTSGQLVVGYTPSSLSLAVLRGVGTQVSCTGMPNQTYVIQATSNLGSASSWANLATNKMDSTGVFVWSDTHAAQYRCRFYRMVRQ